MAGMEYLRLFGCLSFGGLPGVSFALSKLTGTDQRHLVSLTERNELTSPRLAERDLVDLASRQSTDLAATSPLPYLDELGEWIAQGAQAHIGLSHALQRRQCSMTEDRDPDCCVRSESRLS